jgi:DNA (cytosine-5)-methyltransferase 1
MRYLSVCSGIEAATVAWHPLGWEPAGFSEIEKFPSQVLAHHYPDVPNLGDMTNYKEWDIGTIDLLVGGTPCQSFSVAGLRKGMADPRGNLALVYCGILDHFRPKWFVWENVPGVLSSGEGRDFGSFLGALAELGYGFAYRVLDAQWFGVAQRRRRVFVVGCLGDWRSAAAVLFERQSLRRNLAPCRETWQKVAPTVVQGPPYSRTGNERVECEAIVAQCLTTGTGKRYDPETETILPVAQPIPFGVAEQPSVGHCLRAGASKADKHESTTYVAHPTVLMDQGGSVMNVLEDGTVGTLRRETHGHEPSIVQHMAVRRLTTTECERLQGFPDGYTDIQPNNKQTPDGPRYKALGNSMAVPVMNWIGKRIKEIA